MMVIPMAIPMASSLSNIGCKAYTLFLLKQMLCASQLNLYHSHLMTHDTGHEKD